MATLQQQYSELLSLTQIYLYREYALKNKKFVDSAVLSFFQKKAKEKPALKLEETASLGQVAPRKNPSDALKQTRMITRQTLPHSIAKEKSNGEEIATKRPLQSHDISSPKVPEKVTFEKSRSQTLEEPILVSSMISAPKLIIEEKPENKKSLFLLDPLTKGLCLSEFHELWKLCKTHTPELKLTENIPCDSKGKKNKEVWVINQQLPAVILFSFNEKEEQLMFLKNLAHAISLRLCPARVISITAIEKNDHLEKILKSSEVRLIISGDHELYLHSKIMQHSRLDSQHGKHFLDRIPLLLLSDRALYLKQAQLKPLIWRAICNELSAASGTLSHVKNN